jgi:hypothetical protein
MPSTINADNGVVSGSSGVKTTADTSGVLALQSNGSTGVTLNTSLNVGIGTTTPAYKLQVVGSVASTGGSSISVFGKTNSDSISNTLYIQNSDGSKAANFQLGSTGILQTWVYGGSSWVNATTITSSGNLLLGSTTDGGGRFQMTGDYARLTDGAYTGYIGKGSDLVVGATASALAVRSDDLILFSIGSSEKFRVANSGQLGIGGANYGTSGQVLTSGGSGAAPSWTTPSAGAIGTDLSYVDFLLTTGTRTNSGVSQTPWMQAVSLDGVSELMMLYGTASAYAVVFNTSTNTFGTPVLVRTFNGGANNSVAITAVSATSVLVCTLAAGQLALETVVLSISGSTVTVNSAVATTLSADSTLIPANTRLITVGTSYVLSYYNTTGSYPKFRAITVSGTVPTVGAEVASSDGTTFASHHTYTNSSTVFVSFSNDLAAQTLSVRGYSVSGTTITASGSVVQLGTVNATICTAPLASSRYVLMYATSSTQSRCAVISLSGSTATSSVAAINLNIAATFAPKIQAFANQAFVLTGTSATDTLSILTDTSGTASLSASPISIPVASTMVGYLSTGKVFLASTTSGSSLYYQYGISSGDPVEEKRFANVTSTTVVTAQTFTGSFNTYSAPLGNFTTNNNYSVPAIRTSAGKTALGYAGATPFTISIDGTYVAKLQQAANPNFTNYNDAISGAVTWAIAQTTSATTTTIHLREITLV